MNNELHFVRQLAREFRRPDWRRMLDEMSSTELSEWADFFRENSFSDALLDAEFSTLKAQVFMLVTGREIDAADFSLLAVLQKQSPRLVVVVSLWLFRLL
ncbi:phage tail assembly protein T [Salmonella enterica]|nr:phage tail assembly protein T [Salmonella enterica]